MDFGPLIALPGIVALIVIWLGSTEKAFLSVYLPVLLLLPNYFYFGRPPLNFAEYAIIPIAIAVLWRTISGKWKWSAVDAFVGLFVLWNFLSDTHASGFNDVFQRIALPLTLALFPYMIGKTIIEQRGIRVLFMRRFVFCLFLDCIICTYEVRMGQNPARTFLLQFLQTTAWPGTVREGWIRAAGPFGHAILMGTIIGIAIILTRYISYLGLWEPKFRLLPVFPVSKEKLILITLIGGLLLTQSRGPWIATIVGVVLASCGTSALYKQRFKKVALLLLVGGFFLFLAAKAYLAQSPEGAMSEEQRSAAYRAVLIDRYQDLALREKLWGWGTNTWPKIRAMPSVDNAYLLMTLMYGITGLLLYGLMLTVSFTRLIRRALSPQELPASERAMLFVLFGVGVSVALSMATVFLGEQLYPLLFLLLGWGEGCLARDPRDGPALDQLVMLDWQPKYRFPVVS
jgi:O-Antigen ligase